MMKIKHFYQPTGNTCGPTCLYMVHEYLKSDIDRGVKPYPLIEDISEMCGTDWIVGTPPDRMEAGMEKMDMEYVEYLGSPRPYDLLREIIETNNIPVLRTITKGVPHWIIVEGFIANEFMINDPWLGEIIYTEKELDEIWKKRDYQFFEIIDIRNKRKDETNQRDTRR